jgi:hypothetical protein
LIHAGEALIQTLEGERQAFVVDAAAGQPARESTRMVIATVVVGHFGVVVPNAMQELVEAHAALGHAAGE